MLLVEHGGYMEEIEKYIKEKIKDIDHRLIDLIDYHEIQRLNQQKITYLTILDVLNYSERVINNAK